MRDFVAQLLLSLPRASRGPFRGDWCLDAYACRSGQGIRRQHTWATARALASNLIEDALNGRTPMTSDWTDKDTSVVNQQETIAAREWQQKLKDPSANGSGSRRARRASGAALL